MLVLVDGFIATAAVAAAADLDRRVLDYCLFAHVSNERGHRLALRALDAHPILDLGLRLGEGSGAALAWPLVVSAAAFLREMATFDSAGVSEEMEAPNALATEEP
jgi:nicotinate-nucleotide--dimethylbenzimidazole phosphoribosyltransferase